MFGGTGSNRLEVGDGDDVSVSVGTDDTIRGSDGYAIIDLLNTSGNFSVDSFSSIEGIYASDAGDSWGWGTTSMLCEGGAGEDRVNAGTGKDTIRVGAGDDSVDGGAGDDRVSGAADDDTLEGGGGNETLDGGTENDMIAGGVGDNTFVYTVGDGLDTITDFNIGNTGALDDGDSTNNDFIDLSNYYDQISERYADLADDNALNQSNTTDTRGRAVDYSDNDEFPDGEGIRFEGASADETSFTQDNTGVACFAEGTLIERPTGPVPVEALAVGDLVTTRDGRALPLLWKGRTDLDLSPGQCAPAKHPCGSSRSRGVRRRRCWSLRNIACWWNCPAAANNLPVLGT